MWLQHVRHEDHEEARIPVHWTNVVIFSGSRQDLRCSVLDVLYLREASEQTL